MAEVPRSAQRDSESPRSDATQGAPALAGVWLVLSGTLGVLLGAACIARDHLFQADPAYAYRFDLTAWGWINLVAGVAVGIAGVGVLAGAHWARFAGVATAMASFLAQFMFIPYYPWWAVPVMTLDLLAIWVLLRFDPAQRRG